MFVPLATVSEPMVVACFAPATQAGAGVIWDSRGWIPQGGTYANT